MKTKIIIGAAIFIFFAFVVSITTAGLLSRQPRNNNLSGQQETPLATSTDSGATSGNSGSTQLTLEEVAKHANEADCWVIISSNVYNVTSYISAHPGGPDAIIPYCGKDATTAFDTKGGRGKHSSTARSILASYLVGKLGTSAPTSEIQQKASTAANTAPASSRESENEREDD